MGALQARERTGEGQFIDTSLLETQMSYISYLFTSFLSTGKLPQPQGSGHLSIVPYQAFMTSDGWVSLATFNDRLWRRACVAMEIEHLADDPRFLTNALRLEHRNELIPLLEVVFLTRTSAEWVEIMDEHDVPLAPVQSVDEVIAHPQVKHREMIQTIEHPTAGTLGIFGFPLKFSETPCEYRMPPPTLGQHTRQILAEYGYGDDRVEDLVKNGVVAGL